jgi:hypothetical protein
MGRQQKDVLKQGALFESEREWWKSSDSLESEIRPGLVGLDPTAEQSEDSTREERKIKRKIRVTLPLCRNIFRPSPFHITKPGGVCKGGVIKGKDNA